MMAIIGSKFILIIRFEIILIIRFKIILIILILLIIIPNNFLIIITKIINIILIIKMLHFILNIFVDNLKLQSKPRLFSILLLYIKIWIPLLIYGTLFVNVI